MQRKWRARHYLYKNRGERIYRYGIVIKIVYYSPSKFPNVRWAFVEVSAQSIFEPRHVVEAVLFGDANARAKISDGFGSVTAPPQTGNSGHAGVVPAGNMIVLDKFE